MMLGLTSVAYWIVQSAPTFWFYFWLAPLIAVAYGTAFFAEKIAPFYDDWTRHDGHGDTKTNLTHTLVYEISNINGLLSIPVICWLFPYQGFWPTDWPLWAQLIVAYLVSDLAFMVMHYLSHRYGPLWRLHAVHHGVGRLYGFNGVVRHPLHQSIDMIVANMPLAIIGLGHDVGLLLGFLVTVTLIVQHSNVDARLGPLQGHLSIGRIHHLHHVNWGTEGDCNFGLLLTVWDKMLGTYKEKPSRPITAKDMGVDELPNFPKGYIDQLMLPFVYKPGAGEPERYRLAAADRAAPTPAQVARAQVVAGE